MRRDTILMAPQGVLRALWQDVRNTLPGEGSANAEIARPYLSMVNGGFYRDIPGPHWVFNALMTDEQTTAFDDFAPGATLVLWVGDREGIPAGVTRTIDPDTGDEIITGTPTYPGSTIYQARTRSQWLLEGSPDEGDPPGRPASATQVHTFLGWAPRRFDLI